jgi:ABC-type multidrug transport system fused ATPase/permease subunit
MDEATSALDNTTEDLLIKALEKLKGDRTIIMIAHRLSTVKNCDKLYFMQEGQIKHSGTYEELLSTCDEFRKMAK